MNPEPIRTLARYSAAIPGQRKGRLAPEPIATDPASMGTRAPMRSVQRPMLTAKNIGSKAYSAMSAPTVKGVASRWIA
jgi:hypothetical protein